jgi:hypothetical protein
MTASVLFAAVVVISKSRRSAVARWSALHSSSITSRSWVAKLPAVQGLTTADRRRSPTVPATPGAVAAAVTAAEAQR